MRVRWVMVMAIAGFSLVSGQEREIVDLLDAKVVGQVSDGHQFAPVPKPELPSFRVERAVVDQKKGHKVVLKMVSRPELPQSEKIAVSELTEEEKVAARAKLAELSSLPSEAAPELAMLSVTVYDHQISYVQWWYKNEKFEAWSNVDFNHLGGFSQFQGRGRKYSFMMGIGNSSMERLKENAIQYLEVIRYQMPENLPTLGEWGPGYMLVSGDESNDEAMRVMDALHDLYDNDTLRLKAAYEKREKNRVLREEELRRNPPVKENVNIYMWKKN